MYSAVYVLRWFSREMASVLPCTHKDLRNATPFCGGPMTNKRAHRKVILPWLTMIKWSHLLSCLCQLVPVPAEGQAQSVPSSAGWQVSAQHSNRQSLLFLLCLTEPIWVFWETAAPWSFSCSRKPLRGFPGCCAVGAACQQRTEGWGAAALYSPLTPPAGPSMDWWAGQADTEKDTRHTKELQVAWEMYFSQSLF